MSRQILCDCVLCSWQKRSPEVCVSAACPSVRLRLPFPVQGPAIREIYKIMYAWHGRFTKRLHQQWTIAMLREDHSVAYEHRLSTPEATDTNLCCDLPHVGSPKGQHRCFSFFLIRPSVLFISPAFHKRMQRLGGLPNHDFSPFVSTL